MNLSELCAAVNHILDEQGISVSDGRMAPIVTPRNVRYYRTLGLISPPSRVDGHADYAPSHIDEIVFIKKAQVDGVSLEELSLIRADIAKTPPRSRDFSVHLTRSQFYSHVSDAEPMVLIDDRNLSIPKPPESLRSEPTVLGWSVRVGDVTLSGQHHPPTQMQLDAVAEILRRGDENLGNPDTTE